MTTTMHDTTLRWQDCPVCSRLQRELEQARVEREQAWSALTGVDLQFSEAMDAGHAYIGTDAWQRWRDLLDSLTLQDDRAAESLQASLAAWGESIREHAEPQPAESAEPVETPAQTEEMPVVDQKREGDAVARDALAELWYGDVPDFELPDDIMDGSWALLHAASVAISAYMRLLDHYAPATAKGYPAWVANRLRDILDETAIQRAITDQGGQK